MKKGHDLLGAQLPLVGERLELLAGFEVTPLLESPDAQRQVVHGSLFFLW